MSRPGRKRSDDRAALDALAMVRAIVQAEEVLAGQLEDAVRAAREAEADGHALAQALNVHRATLYRRFPVGAE